MHANQYHNKNESFFVFLNIVLVPGTTAMPGLSGEICGGGKKGHWNTFVS
jgi:hypothetical protein